MEGNSFSKVISINNNDENSVIGDIAAEGRMYTLHGKMTACLTSHHTHFLQESETMDKALIALKTLDFGLSTST